MADSRNDRILFWDSNRNRTAIVVGRTSLSPSNSSPLHAPAGIAIDDRTGTLYIADTLNDRIQRYRMNGNAAAVTVAGWGQLNRPNAVLVHSSSDVLFIADTLNHRILAWEDGASRGRTVAGSGIPGTGNMQLDSPARIAFDADYNLYVTDTNNCRIQRFNLVSNGC